MFLIPAMVIINGCSTDPWEDPFAAPGTRTEIFDPIEIASPITLVSANTTGIYYLGKNYGFSCTFNNPVTTPYITFTVSGGDYVKTSTGANSVNVTFNEGALYTVTVSYNDGWYTYTDSMTIDTKVYVSVERIRIGMFTGTTIYENKLVFYHSNGAKYNNLTLPIDVQIEYWENPLASPPTYQMPVGIIRPFPDIHYLNSGQPNTNIIDGEYHLNQYYSYDVNWETFSYFTASVRRQPKAEIFEIVGPHPGIG